MKKAIDNDWIILVASLLIVFLFGSYCTIATMALPVARLLDWDTDWKHWSRVYVYTRHPQHRVVYHFRQNRHSGRIECGRAWLLGQISYDDTGDPCRKLDHDAVDGQPSKDQSVSLSR